MSTEDSKSIEIALIKKDVRNLEKLIEKVDDLANSINELSKLIAIQHKIIETHEKRINDLANEYKNADGAEYEYRAQNRDRMDTLKEHVMANKDEIRDLLEKSVADLKGIIEHNYQKNDSRLTSLENWKWWVMGVGITVTTFISIVLKMFT